MLNPMARQCAVPEIVISKPEGLSNPAQGTSVLCNNSQADRIKHYKSKVGVTCFIPAELLSCGLK